MSRSRVTCQGCKNRSSQNQLKASKGLCTHCGFDIEKGQWINSRSGRDIQSLGLDNNQVDQVFKLARDAGLHPNEVVKTAVVSKIFNWNTNPTKFNQDRMLCKLVKE